MPAPQHSRIKKNAFRWWALLLLIFVTFRLARISQRPDVLPVASEFVFVSRVVDGDTLVIEGDRRVRLLGVDTPETKHPSLPVQPFGEEASRFTRRMVEGKTVQLVFDRERFDDFQRVLAFVFIGDRFLNEELVRAGLATAEPQYPYRADFKKRLLLAEQEAQAGRLGIWSIPVRNHP